jgi:DnaK suppressor protein
MARSATPARPSFTGEELATLRAALEQCRDERTAQLSVAQDESATADPVAVARAASVRRVLGEIVAALERMDAGTYGACTSCDTSIPYVRLEVLPHTPRCVSCVTRRDQAW